jgi:hypothetical protein
LKCIKVRERLLSYRLARIEKKKPGGDVMKTCDEGLAILLACIEEHEQAAHQALSENAGYAEVIDAISAALFGDWEDHTFH